MRMTTDNGANFAACAYLDGVQKNCNLYGESGPLISRPGIAVSLGTFCFSALPSHISKNCLNAPITNVYNCSGAICFTAPQTSDLSYTDFAMVLWGVQGTIGSTVNGVQNTASNLGGGSWRIDGSSWPGDATYTGGGTMNPYTQLDMYVKSVRVWTCADWQTTQCVGTPLTTSP